MTFLWSADKKKSHKKENNLKIVWFVIWLTFKDRRQVELRLEKLREEKIQNIPAHINN